MAPSGAGVHGAAQHDSLHAIAVLMEDIELSSFIDHKAQVFPVSVIYSDIDRRRPCAQIGRTGARIPKTAGVHVPAINDMHGHDTRRLGQGQCDPGAVRRRRPRRFERKGAEIDIVSRGVNQLYHIASVYVRDIKILGRVPLHRAVLASRSPGAATGQLDQSIQERIDNYPGRILISRIRRVGIEKSRNR